MRGVAFIIGFLVVSTIAQAVPPVVKTVPWVSSSPLVPHTTWSGKAVTLKGTCDVPTPLSNFEYFWDFGDGSTTPFANVTDKYNLGASHAYVGALDTVFTARLTVRNKTTGETADKTYYVQVRPQNLETEVNVAIDEGLWYLHKNQIRRGSPQNDGYWSGATGATAANVNAFEINGHFENGDAANPYVETVNRGLRYVFTRLFRQNLSVQALGNPDSNGNGYGLYTDYPDGYQCGILMDAIMASGTPTATAPTGIAEVMGRTYKDIVQDIVDYYAYSQYDGGGGGYAVLGGWRYSAQQFPDNSAAQWAAIGLFPAEHSWGCIVPPWVKPANLDWLRYSQDTTGSDAGVFGYTGPSPIFGPFATTPSGMVQLAMNGIGRGNIMWDRSETFMRDHFGDAAGEGQYWLNVKEFYYGLFAFVKSMLLHDSNGDGVSEPIQFLKSSTPGVLPLDWYAAQMPPYGTDTTDGVARSLLKDQLAAGNWSGHSWTSETDPLVTAWAILMLRRTIVESGPVAVAKATPNPAVAGQIIQLDGSDSFHLDASKLIDSWEWDLNNDGIYDVSGPFPTVSFPALGDYPIKLRVSDNGTPESFADTIVTIKVTIPPLAPTANAGGPYSFCLGSTPWYLNGSGSSNPDEGLSEPGKPGDTIISYEWDLDGDGQYDDAVGSQPDVTAFLTALGPGSHLIQLRVTDRTSVSFPSSGQPNLVDTDSTVVVVRSSTDPECACVDDLKARPKPGKIQLTWTHAGAHHYNVYRGTVSGGPYLKIGSTTSTYSTYLDSTVVNGTTYYYVVREADLLDHEACQSNQASAKPSAR
jgi:hypothetical protein